MERRKKFEFVTTSAPGDFNKPQARRRIFSHAMKNHLASKDSKKTRSASGRWSQYVPDADSSTSSTSSVAVNEADSTATSYSQQDRDQYVHANSATMPTSILKELVFSVRPSDEAETRSDLDEFLKSQEQRRSKAGHHLKELVVWPGHPSVLRTNLTGGDHFASELHAMLGSAVDPFDAIPYLPAGSNGTRFDEMQHGCLVCGFGAVVQTKWFAALVRIDPLANTVGQLPWAINSSLREGRAENAAVMALKMAALQAIQDNLRSTATRYADLTLIAICSMCCYEIWKGDMVAVESHRQGLDRLVRARGGIFQVSVNYEVACIIACKFISSSLCLNKRPPRQYYNFAKSISSPPHPKAAPPWPDSPLFCPTNSLEHLKAHPLSTHATIEALDSLRELTTLLLSHPPDPTTLQSRAHEIYEVVLEHSRASARRPPRPGQPFRKYFALRAMQLAMLLYAAAIAHRIPLAAALPTLTRDCFLPAPLDELATCIQHSEHDSLWGGYGDPEHASMTGVYLFVGLVGASAALPTLDTLRRQRDARHARVVAPVYSREERWCLTAMLNPVVFTTTGFAEAYLGPLCAMSEVNAWLRGEDPRSLGAPCEGEVTVGVPSILPLD